MIFHLVLLAASAESPWIADVSTARRHELTVALPDSASARQAKSVPESQGGLLSRGGRISRSTCASLPMSQPMWTSGSGRGNCADVPVQDILLPEHGAMDI